ncbi:hypothetical protein Taro_021515, partial [Colocasia esculenta]|nr:hypothetical protein [Colocasia esculenta]
LEGGEAGKGVEGRSIRRGNTDLVGFYTKPSRPYKFKEALCSICNFTRCSLDAKFKLLQSFGWTEAGVHSVVWKHPAILKYSPKKLRNVMYFLLNEVGCDLSYIARNPALVGYSMEKRLKPRFHVPQSLKAECIPAEEETTSCRPCAYLRILLFRNTSFHTRIGFPNYLKLIMLPPQKPDWRQYHDVDVVSASTTWTPTLTLASSDVDANFSDLHALQSPEFREQATPTIGELSPTARGNQGEGFPTTGLAPASTKNPEEWSFGGFLGQPKESFTKLLIPLECTQKASTLPIVFIQELGVNALTPSSKCASSDLAVHFWNGQRPPPSSSEQNNKLFCPSMWIISICVVGDDTLAEEALETDSKRGD